MAMERYPRYVHQGDKSFKVLNPEEHAKRFPADYQELVKQIEFESKTDSTITVLEAKERERCAQIAENTQRGSKLGILIAAKIRAAGPSTEKLAEMGLLDPEPAPVVFEPVPAEVPKSASSVKEAEPVESSK